MSLAPMLSRFLPLLALAVPGCTSSVVLPATGSAEFDPMSFFAGHTHGQGTLKKLFSSPVRVTVDSVGNLHGDTLILEQTIREGDKAPSVRRWTIRRVAPNLYSGTLTDAVGAVGVEVTGPRAYIHYAMKHGLRVEQQLAWQGDGSTVLNRLVVHKFGASVATLDERIQKTE